MTVRRGGTQHPKVYLLAAALGLERWGAVGILETLWQWASYYAPQGDVGRYPDAVIAEGVGWRGDPSVLVTTLVHCRLLDTDPTYRLVIHDLETHADDTWKRSLARQGTWFVNTRKKVRKTSSIRDKNVGHCPASPPEDAARLGKASSLQREEESEKKGDPAVELLEYLNTTGGTHFEPVDANLRLIRARLREVDDWTLAAMIRRQWASWKDKPEMRPYFRPATLFGAEKCAQYVGLLTDTDRAWIERQRKAVAS